MAIPMDLTFLGIRAANLKRAIRRPSLGHLGNPGTHRIPKCHHVTVRSNNLAGENTYLLGDPYRDPHSLHKINHVTLNKQDTFPELPELYCRSRKPPTQGCRRNWDDFRLPPGKSGQKRPIKFNAHGGSYSRKEVSPSDSVPSERTGNRSQLARETRPLFSSTSREKMGMSQSSRGITVQCSICAPS